MPEVSSRQERDLFLGRELGQDLVDVKVLVSGRHDGGVWDEVEQYIQYKRWRVGDQSESVSNHGGEIQEEYGREYSYGRWRGGGGSAKRAVKLKGPK